MSVKKKKIGSAGRFGAGYGKVKERLVAVEKLQRIRQKCPFCRGRAKRIHSGIWHCIKCGKKFASNVFHL
jgi:ribosomal protein L37AE/L43A